MRRLTLLTLTLLSVTVGGYACGSFEECVNSKVNDDHWYYNAGDARMLKAIAIELHELRKELQLQREESR